MNKGKFLNLLGLAQRAGKLVSGEDLCLKELRSGTCHLMIIASDASNRTKDRFDKKSYFYKVKVIDDFTTNELSNAIGKENRKTIAIIDPGFAKSLQQIKRGDDDES